MVYGTFLGQVYRQTQVGGEVVKPKRRYLFLQVETRERTDGLGSVMDNKQKTIAVITCADELFCAQKHFSAGKVSYGSLLCSKR